MKKKIFLVASLLMLPLTACSTKEVVEEPPVEEITYKTYELKEEMLNSTVENGKIQVLDSIVTLPVKFKEFKDATGLDVNTDFTRDFNASKVFNPQEEIKLYLTSNGTDIITVVVKNTDETSLKIIDECEVLSVDISRTTSADLNKSLYGLVYSAYGITYGDNFDNAKIKLEESGIDPIHTKNTKTDVMYYKQDDYSLTFFYDSETKEIVQIIYKFN